MIVLCYSLNDAGRIIVLGGGNCSAPYRIFYFVLFHFSKDACVLSESVQKKKKGKKGEYDQVTVLTLEYLIPVEKDDCFVIF